MSRTYTANQTTVVASDDQRQSLLFDIVTVGAGTFYRSTKDYSYGGNAYVEGVITKGQGAFRGLKYTRGKSGLNINVADKLQFSLDNSDGALTASDFADASVLIQIVVSDGTLEEVVVSAKFRVKTPPKDTYDLLQFDCVDIYADKLDGMWPTTPFIKDLFLSTDSPPPILDNMVVPVIIGDAYIPVRSIYVSGDTARYYVLGFADSKTYTIDQVQSPHEVGGTSVWTLADGFAFTQATKAHGGVNYRVFQPIINDSDSDGVADSNGLWRNGTFFWDMLAKYREDSTAYINGSQLGTATATDGTGVTLTYSGTQLPASSVVGSYVVNRTTGEHGLITANAGGAKTVTCAAGLSSGGWSSGNDYTIGGVASVIKFIMTNAGVGMGWAVSDLNSEAFGVAEVEMSEWATDGNTGLVWKGGFYFQQSRKIVLSELLNMCHCFLDFEATISLKVLSKASQATLDKEDVEEGTFKWDSVQVKDTDSAYVAYPLAGEPQDILYPVLVAAKATADNPVSTTRRFHLIDDAQHAQDLMALSLQRDLLKNGGATFKTLPTQMKLLPNDVITVNDSLYGASVQVFIDSVSIDKDLKMTLKTYSTKSALDDYDDINLPDLTYADFTNDSTISWDGVTVGPDGPPTTGDEQNGLRGRLRLIDGVSQIVLDPSVPIIKVEVSGDVKVAQGNLNGLLDYVTDVYGFAAITDASNFISVDPVNGLRISASIQNAITIKNGGGILIEDGGDITITGAVSNQGKLIFTGTTYDTELYANTSGDLFVYSTGDGNSTINFGQAANRFGAINGFSSGFIEFKSYTDADNFSNIQGFPTWAALRVTAFGTARAAILNASSEFTPSPTDVIDLGSSSFKWKDGYFGGDISAPLIEDRQMTGFQAWTSGAAGATWTITGGGEFQLDRDGYGYIDGIRVDWSATLTTAVLNADLISYIYIDTAGAIQVVETRTDALYTDNIVLFEVHYDGTNYHVVKDNHPYGPNAVTSNYMHHLAGTVLTGSGATISRTASGTGSSANDRRLDITGNAEVEDHGLQTTVSALSGVNLSLNHYYTDGAGNWKLDSTDSEFPMEYNNAGTPTVITNNQFGVFRVYISKDDIESSNPTYYSVMHTAKFPNQGQADDAISAGVAEATGPLAGLELAQLGYVIVKNTASGGYIIEVIVAKSTLTSSIVGSGGSNTAGLVTLDVTNFDGILSASDTNVQVAMETLDDFADQITGTNSDSFTINLDGTDVDAALIINRTTGGSMQLTWNGVLAQLNQPFKPVDLGINRISASEPSPTFSGMVWLDTN